MYRESSLTGSCKSAIHLHKFRAKRPGRLSKAASTKPTRSCTDRLPARAMLLMVGPLCAKSSVATAACTTRGSQSCVCVRVVCDEPP